MAATDTEEARYEIHPKEAEIVRRIFQEFTHEGKSIGTIAKGLTKAQVPTRRQVGQWDRSVIWAMLKNPASMGRAAYRKTRVVSRTRPTKRARDRSYDPKHAHASRPERAREDWMTIPVPALIREEVFQRAQQQLQENKKFSPRNPTKYEYLFSGLVRCKECGYALYGKPASHARSKRWYYRCMGQDGYRWPKRRVCSSHPIRVAVVDELVWEQTNRLIKEPELVFKEYVERINKKNTDQLSLEAVLEKKKTELRQKELEKQRLLDLYQGGSISVEAREPRLTALRSKIKKIEQESMLVEQEKKREWQQLQLIEQFEEFRKHLDTNLSNLKFEDKKALVR